MTVLPTTDKELIAQCQREYEEAAQHGGQEAVDACYRLSWALVHGPSKADIHRGLELCEAMLSGGGSADQRELLYLVAVAKFRLKHFVECRRSLKSLLEVRGASASSVHRARGLAYCLAAYCTVSWSHSCWLGCSNRGNIHFPPYYHPLLLPRIPAPCTLPPNFRSNALSLYRRCTPSSARLRLCWRAARRRCSKMALLAWAREQQFWVWWRQWQQQRCPSDRELK